MDTIDTFKSALDSFFTNEHCNGYLNNEDDFQEKAALHLKDNGFYVLRELHINAIDWPLIKSKLHQEYIEIDIVAYKDGLFFPVELKFQDKDQSDHVTEEVWEHDKDKVWLLYKTFTDMPNARLRFLSNDARVWKRFERYDWTEVKNTSAQNPFKYIWRWWQDELRNPKDSFVRFWNNNAQSRIDKKTEKKGDNLCIIK